MVFPVKKVGIIERGCRKLTLVDVSDIFFSARGGGRGTPRRRECHRAGGDRLFIENPRRGGLQERRGLGAGRVSAGNWELGIGGRG